MSLWLNIFPDEDHPIQIGKKLLRPVSLFSFLACSILLLVVLVRGGLTLDSGMELSRMEGVLFALLQFPVAVICGTFAGAVGLWFFRRVPLIKHSFPKWKSDEP